MALNFAVIFLFWSIGYAITEIGLAYHQLILAKAGIEPNQDVRGDHIRSLLWPAYVIWPW